MGNVNGVSAARAPFGVAPTKADKEGEGEGERGRVVGISYPAPPRPPHLLQPGISIGFISGLNFHSGGNFGVAISWYPTASKPATQKQPNVE